MLGVQFLRHGSQGTLGLTGVYARPGVYRACIFDVAALVRLDTVSNVQQLLGGVRYVAQVRCRPSVTARSAERIESECK